MRGLGWSHGERQRIFTSLTNPNYRTFFIGQLVSVVGTWMQRIAQDWLVLELGGGPLQLSIVIGLQALPIWFIGLWSGLITDRRSARTVLLWTQSVFALTSAVLAGLLFAGLMSLWTLYVFAFIIGCANVIDKPARNAFVLDMVGADHAVNAVSLNSSINNASRLVGPAIAGLIIAATNTGVAFAINALTFAAVIVALARISVSSLRPRALIPRSPGQIVGGLRVAYQDVVLSRVLVATLIISTLAQNMRVLLPIAVVDTFGGDASRYGTLMSALGLGALVGALLCARLTFPHARTVAILGMWFGVTLVAGALAPTYAFLVLMLVAVGSGHTSFNATSQSLLLISSRSDMRGRILGIRQLLADGLSPLSSVFIGWVCVVSSPRVALAIGAVAAFSGSLVIWPLQRIDRLPGI